MSASHLFKVAAGTHGCLSVNRGAIRVLMSGTASGSLRSFRTC